MTIRSHVWLLLTKVTLLPLGKKVTTVTSSYGISLLREQYLDSQSTTMRSHSSIFLMMIAFLSLLARNLMENYTFGTLQMVT